MLKVWMCEHIWPLDIYQYLFSILYIFIEYSTFTFHWDGIRGYWQVYISMFYIFKYSSFYIVHKRSTNAPPQEAFHQVMVLVGISIARDSSRNEGERVADHWWLAWEVEQPVVGAGHVECKAARVLNASLLTFIGLTAISQSHSLTYK